MTSLHITNGDSVIPTMQKVGVKGDILPWRDILHEGPVPGDAELLDLESLSDIRADFISGEGWAEKKEVRDWFRYRDATIKKFTKYDCVILWFEQDLYDQLQLLQILHWFYSQSAANLFLIQADHYLGMMSPEQLAKLVDTEQPVTAQQLQLAYQAWNAFRSDDPLAWQSLMEQDTEALPFLNDAVVRMLEEYPSVKNGLSRTQQQALLAIESGESRPGYVFGMSQDMEKYKFMGDTTFWYYLNQMLQSEPPLLTLPTGNTLSLPVDAGQLLTATKAGLEVLHGQRNWLDIHEVDRWIGGVHLTSQNLWCWDGAENTLKRI